MASIEELKARVDLLDLAQNLGLSRPGGRGNFKSPWHDDKSPSLSINAQKGCRKDWSTDQGGSCVDLVMYVEGCDLPAAMRRTHNSTTANNANANCLNYWNCTAKTCRT